MEYYLRRRKGGRNPYLVVQEDGTIVQSFPSKSLALNAIEEYQKDRPYYESIIEAWNALVSPIPLYEDAPVLLFGRTPYGQTIRSVIQELYEAYCEGKSWGDIQDSF